MLTFLILGLHPTLGGQFTVAIMLFFYPFKTNFTVANSSNRFLGLKQATLMQSLERVEYLEIGIREG